MSLDEFAMLFDRCMLCGATARESFPPKLDIHHIARGVHRAKALNERCALLMVCPLCHEKRLDGMSVVTQLAIKKICDPDGYDRVQVNRLRSRADEAITESEVNTEVKTVLNAMPFTRLR